MNDLEEIRSRINSHQRARARATVSAETASVRLKEAREELSKEYGVSNSDDYKKLIKKLKKEAESALVELEASLDEAGA